MSLASLVRIRSGRIDERANIRLDVATCSHSRFER